MIPVKDVMTKDVIFVKPTTPIYEAMNLLTTHEISGMPVVNDQMHLVGMLTEKDVLQLLLSTRAATYETVENYMSRKVVSFSEDDDVKAICEFFIKTAIRRVPIVRKETLVGIVSRRDIITLILEANTKISPHRYS